MEALNKSFNDVSYETRQLAFELEEERQDRNRVSYLLEEGADLKIAMKLADRDKDFIVHNPDLRLLKLDRFLK